MSVFYSYTLSLIQPVPRLHVTLCVFQSRIWTTNTVLIVIEGILTVVKNGYDKKNRCCSIAAKGVANVCLKYIFSALNRTNTWPLHCWIFTSIHFQRQLGFSWTRNQPACHEWLHSSVVRVSALAMQRSCLCLKFIFCKYLQMLKLQLNWYKWFCMLSSLKMILTNHGPDCCHDLSWNCNSVMISDDITDSLIFLLKVTCKNKIPISVLLLYSNKIKRGENEATDRFISKFLARLLKEYSLQSVGNSSMHAFMHEWMKFPTLRAFCFQKYNFWSGMKKM